MAEDKKQSNDTQDTKPDTAASQGDKVRKVQKSDSVDIASINASAADASGTFVRDGGKGQIAKKSAAKTAQTKTAPDKKKKKEFVIPVLRTYQNDQRSVAQTKGGAELRTILAKEAEEKRKAQEEYIRNTKDIMKESVVLRDQYKNLSQKKESGDRSPTPKVAAPKKNTDTQPSGQQDIDHALSGVATYMQSNDSHIEKKQRSPLPTQESVSKKMTPPPAPQQVPTPTKQQNKTQKPAPQEPRSAETKKQGIFARIRGRISPKDVFTTEQRESMQQKQQEVVKKESFQDAWKDFKKKKEKLRQMGLAARDVRSYSAHEKQPEPNRIRNKQNVIIIIAIFFLLAGLVSSIVYLAISPAEKRDAVSEVISNPLTVPDILNSEQQVFVDMADETASAVWQSITDEGGEQGVVTKFVPYQLIGETETQLNFQDFSRAFSLRIPVGLQNAFDNYYFVGNYATQTSVQGIFIVSVKKYGDAFVWMRSWEKNAINALTSVFPGFLQQSKTVNSTAESRIIDNQDVRIIQNPQSQKDLLYYFFGRSILVFVVGDASIIPLINTRIRSANTR